jgi:hypothetical protein
VFNAEDFLNQTTEATMQDKWTEVPEGEYLAQIGDGPNDLTVEGIQGKKDPTKTYPRLTLFYYIIDENLKAKLGKSSIRVRQQFLLDMDENGKLATGADQNVRLGQIRAAVGLNSPGQAFALSMLRGRGPVRAKVKQRLADDGQKYSEVSAVAAA